MKNKIFSSFSSSEVLLCFEVLKEGKNLKLQELKRLNGSTVINAENA